MAQSVVDTGAPIPNTDLYESVDTDNLDEVDGGVISRAPRGAQRVIHINGHQSTKFCSNKISTAKYSFYTFLPKFLYELFRKYSNIFFLFVGCMQQIPDVSPTGKFTTLGPLLIILCVSAIKELIEDFKRHRADDEVNKRKVLALREGRWTDVLWTHVVVGDIVRVSDGQFFPSDLLLLSSSEPQGMCYIETSNLDGETNLKIRQGLPCTASLLTLEDLISLKGYIECELPNRHLYEFIGNICPTGTSLYPLGPDQVLLRGAKLKNTKWIFGIVLFTGKESKLMLNSTSAPLKRSSMDRVVNKQTLMLFAVLIFISLVSAVANEIWTRRNIDSHWYLGLAGQVPWWKFFMNFLTFIILYNNLIPISLQVTLEVVKFIQAIFISWDLDMCDEESDTTAMARTSNLNEELGQVQYIFSDKTGTLTRNIMEFRKCSIAGVRYGDNTEECEGFCDASLLENLHNGHKTSDQIREFLTLLAVCHTVVPEQDRNNPEEINYQASSPDERALVLGARGLGFVFSTRTPDSVVIEVMGVEEKYEILNVLEFTSDRKRMSVIVRTPSGSLKLLTKGADNVITKRLSKDQPYLDATIQHLEEFAAIGLRTLCIAVAEISESFYDKWKEIFYKASTSLHQRDRKLAQAAELIEKDLFLLGATAIEDKLQKEVPESIATLMNAGIKIWVLTGDKQETAVNIGYSSRLLTQNMQNIFLNESSDSKMHELLKHHINGTFYGKLRADNPVAVIIDGESLKFALSFECQQDFLDIALSCRAVICCRVSPLQKAEIVQLVRNRVKVITLAIGDGANDVGMIQAAHVGIGISGQEGLQAACASDYSIAQFRFLIKLLLVHGAWSYHRLTKLILYSFYKNICLYLIQFWFAWLSGFTGQVVFERWSIALYNVLFTAAPPMAIGLFDQYCSAKSMKRYPSLYKASQGSQNFSIKIFWLWCVNAVYHSIVVFWLTVFMLHSDIAFKDGLIGNHMFLGNMVYTYVVITVCIKSGLEMSAWTLFAHISIWGSIGLWFMFLIIYPHLWPTINLGADMVGMDVHVLSCGLFWMGLILIPTTALLRDLVWKSLRRTLYRTVREDIREKEFLERKPHNGINNCLRRRWRFAMNVTGSDQSEEMNVRSQQQQQQHHGFAFSQEEGGAMRQADVIRAYNTTEDKPSGM